MLAMEPSSILTDICCARCARAADAERRRLERDLHDGAQQRLVALAVQLHLVGMQLEPGSEAGRLLAEAQQQLTASLAELPSSRTACIRRCSRATGWARR